MEREFSTRSTFSRLCRCVAMAVSILTVSSLTCAVSLAAPLPKLAGVIVDGNTLYAPDQLLPAYRQHLGRELSPDRLDSIVDALQKIYRSDGHLSPEIVIANKQRNDNVVRLQINEIHVGAVQLAGNAGPYRARIAEWIEPLDGAEPVSANDVRSVLHRLRALPGLSAAADTREGAGWASRDIQLNLDYQPVVAALQVSNRGTEKLGHNIFFGRIRINGQLGWAETVDLLATASADYDRYHGGGISFAKSVNAKETRVSALALSTRGKLHFDASSTPDRYRRDKFRLRIEQPLIDERQWRLSLSASLLARDLKVVQSDEVQRDEHLRSAAIGAHYAFRSSERTVYRGELEVRRGLPGFGSRLGTPSANNDPRRVDFTLMEFDVEREMRWAGHWRLELGARGQYSGQFLPGSERFSIGGEKIGGAYEVAELSGDRGLGGKAELGRNASVPWFSQAEIYGYYDIGAVWSDQGPGRRSAASAGSGLSIVDDRLRAYIELSRPLTRASERGGKNVRLFAEVLYRF